MTITTSGVFTIIIGFILSIGIAGAFWSRHGNRKKAVRDNLGALKTEISCLPTRLISGIYPELDSIDELIKKEKLVDLKKMTIDIKNRFQGDRERLAKLREKIFELERLVKELCLRGAKTNDLESILRIIREEGIK